jgi:hypothetical protein
MMMMMMMMMMITRRKVGGKKKYVATLQSVCRRCGRLMSQGNKSIDLQVLQFTILDGMHHTCTV